MKLINADYLTGRIFTEADLTNAHTCYESIMAIIESMELDDALYKIRTEIMDINVVRDKYSQRQNDYCDGVEFAKRYVLQIIDKYKASPTGGRRERGMNKYIVFLTDGRQCELTADKINHFSDGIEFIQNENIIVAWFNPNSLAGYVICPKQEVVE